MKIENELQVTVDRDRSGPNERRKGRVAVMVIVES